MTALHAGQPVRVIGRLYHGLTGVIERIDDGQPYPVVVRLKRERFSTIDQGLDPFDSDELEVLT